MPDTVRTVHAAERRGARFLLVLAVALAISASGCRDKPPPAPPQPVNPPQPVARTTDAPAIPFVDVTDEWGIDFVHRSGSAGEKLLPESGGGGVALFDYDADGDLDLLMLSGAEWPWTETDETQEPSVVVLYRNDGEQFVDITQEAGLELSFYAQGVAAGDYDADGDLDLFFTGLAQSYLLRNDGGHFVDATAASGIASHEDDWLTSCGFVDYDRDGDLDLFLCNYVEWSRELDLAANYKLAGIGRSYAPPFNFAGTNNYLYRNDGGQFVDVSQTAGIHVNQPDTDQPVGKALAVVFVDFDRDGWIDIFIANDTVRNFLYRNQQDGTFVEVGEELGIAFDANGGATSAMGADVAWLRNTDDLAISVGNFANEMTSLFVTQGTRALFTDESMATGVGGPTRARLSFGLLFDDFDLDGRVDLMQANGHLEEDIGIVQPSQHYKQPAQLFWNAGDDGELEFTELTAEDLGDLAKPIVGRAAASGDLDGDGDLDLVLTQVAGPPLVLRNDQATGHHFLRCRLTGSPGNPRGIGAVIRLEAGGITQRRVVSPTRSYLTQTDDAVTFGLGTQTEVDRIVVTWPDGQEQEVVPEAVDTTIVIRREAASYAECMSRAKALFELARYEEAAAMSRTALKFRPDDLPATRNLARCLLLDDDLDAVEASLSEIDDKDPTAATPYLRGLVATRNSDFAQAAEFFGVAAQRTQDVAAVHFQFGKVLLLTNQTDQAREQFERATEIDPIHGAAQYQLANMARKAGDTEVFRRYWRDCERIRELKGGLPTDAVLLEACRLTELELATPPQPTGPAPQPEFTLQEIPTGEFQLADLAVLALSEAGEYIYVATTTDGRVIVVKSDGETWDQVGDAFSLPEFTEESAPRLIVGNAIVDPVDENAAAGDMNEVFVYGGNRCYLLRVSPEGKTTDITDMSGLTDASGSLARWIDIDHDGALDLLVVEGGRPRCFRNRGDQTLVDATTDSRLDNLANVGDLVGVDLQADNLSVDLIAVVDDAARVIANQFGGRFAMDETSESWGAAQFVLADDFDGDGLADVVRLSAGELGLLSSRQKTWTTISSVVDEATDVTTCDFDNDGWLDIVVAGQNDDQAICQLLINRGGVVAEPIALPAAEVSRWLDVDVDSDGDTDLIAIGSDGGCRLLRNDTEPVGRQLKLSLYSFVGQSSSIGVRVQARAGALAVTRFNHRQLPIEIGLGPATVVDTVQSVWGNGVVHNQLDVAPAESPTEIAIVEFIRTSSCPFVYARVDGDWEFVTDVLGAAPLNVAWQRGVAVPADDDEVIRLDATGGRNVNADQVSLKLSSELREAVYVDELSMLVVDHPPDVSIFAADRTGPNPIGGKQFVAVTNRRSLDSARNSAGHDITSQLATIDGNVVMAGAPLDPPAVGHTAPGSIEFTFSDLDATQPQILALTGWFRFGSSSTNIAAAERSDITAVWPMLEARVGGEWVLVDQFVGFPTGNTKTIICRLGSKLPPDAERLRLTTSFEVRWDEIALYDEVPRDAVSVVEVEPATASLAWHGFSRLASASSDAPLVPIPGSLDDQPPWLSTLAGWCTRYGAVEELLTDSDSRLAVLNSGDAMTVDYNLPNRPEDAGLTRTNLLYVRGWIKEWDPNAEPPERVAPFPGSEATTAETSDDWQIEYNTRWVPRTGGWNRAARGKASSF